MNRKAKSLLITLLAIAASIFAYLSLNDTVPKLSDPMNNPWDQEYAVAYETAPPDTAAYYEWNGGIPAFTQEDLSLPYGYEWYSPLDELGRCGPATAMLGPETMPTEERGDISNVKPTGWKNVKYDGISGGYLYNRCHLIAFSLAGENDNELNLITGTRYMNVEGMLPWEMQVLDYLKSTDAHVLYRATPVFTGENLVCDGVILEAQSVEDGGPYFAVFCPNIQPGIAINYATGESHGQ